MNTSSPVRVPTCQEVEAKVYRRDRQHLYPFEEYELACAVGGAVKSFCGVEVLFSSSPSAEVAEAKAPEDDDCVTCVDLWLDRNVVRL